ncbi:hypothetical protein M378DRAFT_410110 [Amanita muscaria Koide BX008]|uniref:Uncharacterized protein n=1 Tax=Amanita muscaria (strain Koide BX008) TaxID=946122 RepID=A0A0C2TH83_AMAMK|nr:hypothetical protein M378DRAFT_410110 [Amanita muscaria Koide BX008]
MIRCAVHASCVSESKDYQNPSFRRIVTSRLTESKRCSRLPHTWIGVYITFKSILWQFARQEMTAWVVYKKQLMRYAVDPRPSEV